MKTKFTFSLLFICCAVNSFSQVQLILQPDSCTAKGAIIADCIPCGYYNSNYGASDEYAAIAWTNGGNVSNERGLLAFDLSSIPAGSTVTGATLSLYWNPDPKSGNAGQSTMSGSNAAWLQRITSQWGIFSVTWANQPSTTNTDEVIIPESTTDTESYPNIDVSALVQDMINNPSQSFGFMLQLQNESYYRALLFASSYHANPALRPKLVINYTPPPDSSFCLTLQPAGGACSDVKSAVIANCVPCGYYNSNYGGSDEYAAIAWTNGGNISNERGLLQFDLSSIPSSATVTSANLSLYWNPDPGSGNAGQSTLSGSDAAWLKRITSTWGEYSVTWANQPGTTDLNEVIIPESSSDTESYPNIDVSALVQDMISNPSQSFGFMLELQDESYYRALLFASPYHANPALRPKLNVCYTTVTGVHNYSADNSIAIYPNPAHDIIRIKNTEKGIGEIRIYNNLGQMLYQSAITSPQSEIDISNFPAGVYFLQLQSESDSEAKMFVKE